MYFTFILSGQASRHLLNAGQLSLTPTLCWQSGTLKLVNWVVSEFLQLPANSTNPLLTFKASGYKRLCSQQDINSNHFMLNDAREWNEISSIRGRHVSNNLVLKCIGKHYTVQAFNIKFQYNRHSSEHILLLVCKRLLLSFLAFAIARLHFTCVPTRIYAILETINA